MNVFKESQIKLLFSRSALRMDISDMWFNHFPSSSKLCFEDFVSVKSKPDHPQGDPRGFAHSSYSWVRVFAPLSCPGVFLGGGGGLNRNKNSIILTKKRDFCFVT